MYYILYINMLSYMSTYIHIYIHINSCRKQRLYFQLKFYSLELGD